MQRRQHGVRLQRHHAVDGGNGTQRLVVVGVRQEHERLRQVARQPQVAATHSAA